MHKLPVNRFFIIKWVEIVTVILNLLLLLLILPQLRFGQHVVSEHLGSAANYLIKVLVNDLWLDDHVAGLMPLSSSG